MHLVVPSTEAFVASALLTAHVRGCRDDAFALSEKSDIIVISYIN